MERIGRYEVVRELGRGGMGVVHEVRDPDAPGRRLALKLLRAEVPDEAALRRFLEREVQLLARVRHANVVAVHTASWAREGPYLVMDLVEGRPLDQVTLAPDEAARVVRALCDALAALHAQGVLHRDLKPRNVVLRPDGTPVLLDFGLARDLEGERLTRTGQLVGTPRYLPPEALAQRPSFDARGDVYGLGAVLFELLGGEPPYAEAHGPAALLEALRRDPVWPSARRPVPRGLEAIVRRAMARDPAERYPSAAALAAALDRHLSGAAEPGGGRRAAAALGALALAGALVAAVVVSARDGARRRAAAAAVAAADALEERTLRPWALGLGEGPPPSTAELEAVLRRLAEASADLPLLDEPRRRHLRLSACARRVGGRGPLAGPTGQLVAALEAQDLAQAVEHLLLGDDGPEWPLVRAELELRALRAGPDAGPALAKLPAGTLEGAAAARHARLKAEALRDPQVAARWARPFTAWIATGSREAALEPLALLRRLAPATARAAPDDEAAFLAGLRRALEPAARGADETLARALLLDACLRTTLGGRRWALDDLAQERLDARRGGAAAIPSPALTAVAVAVNDLTATALLRQLQVAGGSFEHLAPEPARSRACLFMSVLDGVYEDPGPIFEHATACVDAAADDLGPVYLAQAHERVVSSVVALLTSPAHEATPAHVARGLASAVAVRALAREHPVSVGRLAESLRAELDLRCELEGWSHAGAVVAELEVYLGQAPPGRDDWLEAAALTRMRWLHRVSDRIGDERARDPAAAAALVELSLALARGATERGVLGPKDVDEVRALVVRALRKGGRHEEALARVRERPERRAWSHYLFAVEAASTLADVDRAQAIDILRWALSDPNWEREDGGDSMQQLLATLEGR